MGRESQSTSSYTEQNKISENKSTSVIPTNVKPTTPRDESTFPVIQSKDKNNSAIQDVGSEETKLTGVVFPQQENPAQEKTTNTKENVTKLQEFNIENQMLKTLLTPLLANVTLEYVITTINAIKDEETKKNIQGFLLEGKVQDAQKYSGMKVNSLYNDNRATGKIDMTTLERWGNPLFGLSGKQFLDNPNIASDSKPIYQKFVNEKLNNNLPYVIVSKKDCNLYVFNKFHKLISVHKVLLGQQKGEQANDAFVEDAMSKTRTTPGGMYRIDTRAYIKSDYASTGEYVTLYPEEGQYNPKNAQHYTLGMHTYYIKKGNRLAAFDTAPGTGRRITSGCINTLVQGAPYDNLMVGSKFYVTKE